MYTCGESSRGARVKGVVEFAEQIEQLFLFVGRELTDLFGNHGAVNGQNVGDELFAFRGEIEHVGTAVSGVCTAFDQALLHEAFHQTADIAFADEQTVGEGLLGDALFVMELGEDIELGQGEVVFRQECSFAALDFVGDAEHVQPREKTGLTRGVYGRSTVVFHTGC